MKIFTLNKMPTAQEFESFGLSWHQNGYIANECVELSQQEANAFYDAAARAYEMYVKAAEYVIENDLFFELNIPFNLIELIKESWQSDAHWHIYGRFDFAGGCDGVPIKLLEFNADTPTCLFESGFIQYELLRRAGLDTNAQFNTLYEALVNNFKRLICGEDDPQSVGAIPYKILFSCVQDAEEELTMRFLMQAAREAGFASEFAYIDEVEFDSENGVFFAGQNYEYLFTLLPWEIIAQEEPELANIITQMVKNRVAIVLNPAYTLLFQSKGMLKILSELFADDELILRADFAPLKGCKQVKKPFFGREGANVCIIDENNQILQNRDGEYSQDKFVYQEFAELNRAASAAAAGGGDGGDGDGKSDLNYQAGVFFAYEPCALGFRRAANIIDNRAAFCAHFLRD